MKEEQNFEISYCKFSKCNDIKKITRKNCNIKVDAYEDFSFLIFKKLEKYILSILSSEENDRNYIYEIILKYNCMESRNSFNSEIILNISILPKQKEELVIVKSIEGNCNDIYKIIENKLKTLNDEVKLSFDKKNRIELKNYSHLIFEDYSLNQIVNILYQYYVLSGYKNYCKENIQNKIFATFKNIKTKKEKIIDILDTRLIEQMLEYKIIGIKEIQIKKIISLKDTSFLYVKEINNHATTIDFKTGKLMLILTLYEKENKKAYKSVVSMDVDRFIKGFFSVKEISKAIAISVEEGVVEYLCFH